MNKQEKIRYKDIRFIYMASAGAMGGSDVACIVTQGKTGAVWHHFNTRIKTEEKELFKAFPPLKEHGVAFVLHAPPPWHSVDISAGHTVAGYGRAGALFEYACNQHFEARSEAWQKDPQAKFPSLDWQGLIDEILELMAKNDTETWSAL